jgi:predicted RNase H-like HicB family nuclease
MKLIFSTLIEKALTRARYEYDDSVKQWTAWIGGFPGVYAQGKRIEDVRQELALTLEEYILVSVREGKHIPGLSFSKRLHARAA